MMRGNGWRLLLLGALLLAVSQVRWPVFALGWIAPVPFLVALRRHPGMGMRLAFVAVYLVAWIVATLKIVTPPLTPAMALIFAVPITLAHVPAFFVWDVLVRRRRETWAVAGFAAATALLEWVQATYTPFVSWGATAYSQLDNLPLLQLASVAGLPGLALLLNAAAAAIELGVSRPESNVRRRIFAGTLVAGALVHAWGAVRLASPFEGPSVRVAAVATDATFSRPPLPGAAEVARIEAALRARTERAAQGGATLIVWPEAATLVWRSDEVAFRARTSALARTLATEIVAAFVVPVSLEPLRYENKYVWFSRDGAEVETYLKHTPVPGEPAIKGTTPAVAHDTVIGRLAGAICYDYDVPPMGLAHARLGVDLVALPSSDWAGIDPIHTQMAGVRAIEGGFSILRSTRLGLSAGIDARGRLRGWMTALEHGDGVLLVELPARRVPTVYGRLGDLVIAPLGVLVCLALFALKRRAP
jgi:apolipoprotein N-acyltransferase